MDQWIRFFGTVVHEADYRLLIPFSDQRIELRFKNEDVDETADVVLVRVGARPLSVTIPPDSADLTENNRLCFLTQTLPEKV